MPLVGIDECKYIGVDGCKTGWFSVGLDDDWNYGLAVCSTFQGLLDRLDNARLILVDIPIGLPDGPGGRKCDFDARNLIEHRNRKTSIFPTPARRTVQAVKAGGDHQAANETERKIARAKKGISIQVFNIALKIAEVDEVMVPRNLADPPSVREIHPELCFWALNGGQSMQHSKKRPSGRVERLRVLNGFVQAQQIYNKACCRYFRKEVAVDDILDALAAAVTAHLACTDRDRLRTVPKHPPKDGKGLPMEMVYWLRGEQRTSS